MVVIASAMGTRTAVVGDLVIAAGTALWMVADSGSHSAADVRGAVMDAACCVLCSHRK